MYLFFSSYMRLHNFKKTKTICVLCLLINMLGYKNLFLDYPSKIDPVCHLTTPSLQFYTVEA